MAFSAKIDGIEIKKKNRFVLEIVKKYIETYPTIDYIELKKIFPDSLQGSIGVIKNEKDLIAWENDGRSEKREKRFFVDKSEILYLNGENIYVCTQWGDSKDNPNFHPFIAYVKKELDLNIEIISNKVFYGLWIAKDVNPSEIIETGIWENKLSNHQRLDGQIEKVEIGDEVFLFQGIEDVPLENSPFFQYLDNSYDGRNIVKAKSWAIGRVLAKDIEQYSLNIEWKKEYIPAIWYVYYRQDGVWDFTITNGKSLQEKKYQALYDIVFNDKEQDYKWWIEKGVFKRYKMIKEEKNMDSVSNNDIGVKNIILYGSPGVGKTHNVNKLIELIEEEKSDREIFESIKKNTYNSDMNSLELDIKERVRFITFHQSFGYEDFIEGFRPNEDGKIELINGIFKTLAIDANENYVNSILYDKYAKQIKEEEVLFDLFVESIQEEIDSKGKYFLNELVYIFDIDSDSFRYKGENWQNSQKMKFKDIQLLNQFHAYTRKSIKGVPNISGLAKQHATYYSLLANKLYAFLEKTPNEDLLDSFVKEEEKNYYIVIDEINRGNISKIFGELITLIEEDKRGILDITLPYSKDKFRIPKNLYIIGTMNSTDKSIALIDIALRRRFTFLKMEPNADLIDNQEAQKIFIKLNEKITEKLGEDYQIGHSYFMGDIDLKFVLDYKIKPLLEEYFYGDKNGLDEVLELL